MKKNAKKTKNKAAKKTAKKAAPLAKKTEKKGSPLHGNEAVAKVLSGDFVTAVQLADKLEVTKTTAQIYIKKLAKTKKIETSKVRQGKRGPLAIGFKVVGDKK